MKFAVGIGGSGARCLEALLYLSAAGLGPDRLAVFVVDADQSNGNVDQANTVIHAYTEMRKALPKNWQTAKCPLLSNDVQLLKQWNPLKVDGRDAPDLRRLLLLNPDYEKAPPAEKLLRAMYSAEQLEADLSEGFLGRPAIGAAVFALAKPSEEPWITVKQLAADQEEDRFFFFGSVFGGTGAAGLPNLPKLLKSPGFMPGTQVAHCAAALLLPYFEFPDEKTEERELYAHPDEFAPNTRVALEHYASNLKSLYERVYLLGASPPRKLTKCVSGGIAQRNPPHLIELVAALAAVDFLTDSAVRTAAQNGAPEKSPPSVNSDSTSDIKSGSQNNETRLFLAARSKKNDQEQRHVFTWEDLPEAIKIREHLAALARISEVYCEQFFPALRLHFKSEQSRIPWIEDLGISSKDNNEFTHLNTLCGGFSKWLRCLHEKDHGLYLEFVSLDKVDKRSIRNFVVGDSTSLASTFKDVWRLACDDRELFGHSPLASFLIRVYNACRSRPEMEKTSDA